MKTFVLFLIFLTLYGIGAVLADIATTLHQVATIQQHQVSP